MNLMRYMYYNKVSDFGVNRKNTDSNQRLLRLDWSASSSRWNGSVKVAGSAPRPAPCTVTESREFVSLHYFVSKTECCAFRNKYVFIESWIFKIECWAMKWWMFNNDCWSIGCSIINFRIKDWMLEHSNFVLGVLYWIIVSNFKNEKASLYLQ